MPNVLPFHTEWTSRVRMAVWKVGYIQNVTVRGRIPTKQCRSDLKTEVCTERFHCDFCDRNLYRTNPRLCHLIWFHFIWNTHPSVFLKTTINTTDLWKTLKGLKIIEIFRPLEGKIHPKSMVELMKPNMKQEETQRLNYVLMFRYKYLYDSKRYL